MKTTGKKPKRNAGPLRVGNKSKWLPEAFCAMALVFLATIIWCYFRDRLTASSWKIPAQYNGDAIQILGWIKAAAEGDYVPFWTEQIHRLGAPYQANWNDYPMYEKSSPTFWGWWRAPMG